MTTEEQLRWEIQALKDTNAKLHRRVQVAESKNAWRDGYEAGRKQRLVDRDKELEKRIEQYKHSTRTQMAKLRKTIENTKAHVPKFISDLGVERLTHGAGLLASLLEKVIPFGARPWVSADELIDMGTSLSDMVDEHRGRLHDLHDSLKHTYNRVTDRVEVVR